MRNWLKFLVIRTGDSEMLGLNRYLSVLLTKFQLRMSVQNPCPCFPRKVPELALFSFQSSGLSSLLACSSFFPFPSQYMISSELVEEEKKKPSLLPV